MTYIHETLNKNLLENLIINIFNNFGKVYCSLLLDSIKLIGFYYSTNSGISINIEDIKTPILKKNILNNIDKITNLYYKLYKKNIISEIENFNNNINIWININEYLKKKIINYYKKFDPINSIYIMAFSGARGNILQVTQLLGLRGLMSDKEGNLINIFIKNNFREGLNIIDYIVSSYGSRKGIVDTALKTADSGYLTRKLIYSLQDIVIKDINCNTKKGLIFFFNNNINCIELKGKYCNYIINNNYFSYNYILKKDIILTNDIIINLRKFSPLILIIRSVLTCELKNSICQKCYGYDLTKNKIIELGTNVGIIAAHSLGEPCTQLTMRTFHTGGVFKQNIKSKNLNITPFSGKIFFSNYIKYNNIFRTNNGKKTLKLKNNIYIKIKNWKGLENKFYLEKSIYLHIINSSFIFQKKIISKKFINENNLIDYKLKLLYTLTSGQILYKYLKSIKLNNIKILLDNSSLNILPGINFKISNNLKFLLNKNFKFKKYLGYFKLISPINGIISIKNNIILIYNNLNLYYINLNYFNKNTLNYFFKTLKLFNNNQFINKYTIFLYIYFFFKKSKYIYLIKKKNLKKYSSLLFINNKNIFKINSDHVYNTIFNNNILKYNGFKLFIKKVIVILLNKFSILKISNNNFIKKNINFAITLNYKKYNEDIIKGLPKINNLLENHTNSNNDNDYVSILSNRPGIYKKSFFNIKLKKLFLYKNDIIKCIYKIKNLDININKNYYIIHSLFYKNNFTIFNNYIYLKIYIPSIFKLIPYIYNTYNLKNIELLLNNKLDFIKNKKILFLNNLIWFKFKIKIKNIKKTIYNYNTIYSLKSKNILLYKYFKLKYFKMYTNIYSDIIIKNNKFNYIFLKYINPINTYLNKNNNNNIYFKKEIFIDIGEPITIGKINLQNLIDIFFDYHYILNGILNAIIKSIIKFQLILNNSLNYIYNSQGINILNINLKLVIKQILCHVIIYEKGNTPFLINEIIKIYLILEIYKILKKNTNNIKYIFPFFKPKILSLTQISLKKDGFLSNAAFQNTKYILTKSSFEGKTDWVKNLKESIICNKFIFAGSSFLLYKNYLNSIYLFKKE